MNDTINDIIVQGLEIGSQIQHSNNMIPGVDNNLLGSFITIVAGLIIRAVEKRHMKKKEEKRRKGNL